MGINIRYRNDFKILWQYKVSNETNIQSNDRTRLVLRDIAVLCAKSWDLGGKWISL